MTGDGFRRRVLYVTAGAEGVYLLGTRYGVPEEKMLLVEQPDGSWRKPTGRDMVDIRRRFPDFFKDGRPFP